MPKASKKSSIRKARVQKTIIPNSHPAPQAALSFATQQLDQDAQICHSEETEEVAAEDLPVEEEDQQWNAEEDEDGEGERSSDESDGQDVDLDHQFSEALDDFPVSGSPDFHARPEGVAEEEEGAVNDFEETVIDWGHDLNAPALLRTPSPNPQPPGSAVMYHPEDTTPAIGATIKDTLDMMQGIFMLLRAQQTEIAELQGWGDKIRQEASDLQRMVEMEDAKGKRLLQWVMRYDAQDPEDPEQLEGARQGPLKRRRKDGSVREKESGWSFEEMFGRPEEEGGGFDAKAKRRVGSGRDGYEVDSFDEEATKEPRRMEESVEI